MARQKKSSQVNSPLVKLSAVQIATQGVQQHFDRAMVATLDDEENPNLIDETIGKVSERLVEEWERRDGSLEDPDPSGVRELLAQRAGYIVGVQVGLRLREPGGAR